MFQACNRASATEEQTPVQKRQFADRVKTVPAQLGTTQKELILTGKVEYNPEKIIRYAPLVSGTVEHLSFSLGDYVRKGDPLLQIRSSELSALQSENIAAETDLRVAERELKSMRALYADNMLSEKELLEAEAKTNQAKAELDRIRIDLANYRFDSRKGTFSVAAPLSGYIVEKEVATGTPVSADGNPIFTIADLSSVWITVNVYARDLSIVREGLEVEISSQAYPGERFKGTISSLSRTFDPQEKVLKARILIANEDLKFKPDMAVTVRVSNPQERTTVAIPKDALLFDNDKYYVVVSDESGEFRSRRVIPGGHAQGMTFIQEGLDGTEKIVVSNQLLIHTGLKENF